MIGNQEEANAIAECDTLYNECPDGWEYVGAGTFRQVFRAPSGVVYKKEIIPRGNNGAGNRSEYKNLCNIREIPVAGWRIPDFELYVTEDGMPIIAMEFIDGAFEEEAYCDPYGDGFCECSRSGGECVNVLLEIPAAHWGLTDVHNENVLVEEDGTRVLIDAGN